MGEFGGDDEITIGYAPPKEFGESIESEALAPRPSLIASISRAARTGFRRGWYIASPFATIAIMAGLALTCFGLGTGRGLGVPIFVFVACGVWFSFGLGCGLLGGFIGFLRRLIPAAHEESRWSLLNRPLPFLGKRRCRIEESDRTPSPSRKWFWRALIAAPALMIWLVAFAGGVYWGRLVDERVAEAFEDANRDDPYWRLDEVMVRREAVPDEENSAIVLGKALSLLPAGWPMDPVPPAGTIKPPESDVQKAFKVLENADIDVRLEESVVTTLRQEVEAYSEAVRIARTVADYRRGRHELEIPDDPINTLLPETQASRNAARLLAADATIEVDAGRPDVALQDCRAMMGVARSIGDEPYLISQLMRLLIGRYAMKTARRVLAQGQPSQDSLASLQISFLEEMKVCQQNLLIACRGERANLVETFRRESDGKLRVLAAEAEFPAWSWKSSRYPVSPWDKLYLDSQMAVAAHWMNRIVEIVKLPVSVRWDFWDEWEEEFDEARNDSLETILGGDAHRMIPVANRSDLAQNRYEAELGAMVILLAMERHRMKTQGWPGSIEEIDPGLLPDRPDDPFSEEPYLMSYQDGRILIYSVGANLEDENGEFDQRKSYNRELDDVIVELWDLSKRRQPVTEEGTGASGLTERRSGD